MLNWVAIDQGLEEAQLGEPKDGVLFSIQCRPTCYRRGPYLLHIEVCAGDNYVKWGCFDDQDQPSRNFHCLENAKSEADMIAAVLWRDRYQTNKEKP